MDYIERFNIQLYNFFSELYILYPVDNDIYNIKTLGNIIVNLTLIE